MSLTARQAGWRIWSWASLWRWAPWWPSCANGQRLVRNAHQAGLSRESVRLWRDRWVALRDIPLADLSVEQRLADSPRPGAPARITAEQACQVMALACEAPAASGRPISQWTHQEIADEIIRRGIVATISPRFAAWLVKRGRYALASSTRFRSAV